MPAPKPFGCGGDNQPPCPPEPAAALNTGDVFTIGNDYWVVVDDTEDQGQNEDKEQAA